MLVLARPAPPTDEALALLVKYSVPLNRIEATGQGGIVTAADVIRAVEQDDRDAATHYSLWPTPDMVVPPLTEDEQALLDAAYPSGRPVLTWQRGGALTGRYPG